jgi:hypothetical protein
MIIRKCYKCGKKKIAIKSEKNGKEIESEMTISTWGKNQGRYYCLDCNKESKYVR